jgi:hypothetical protein
MKCLENIRDNPKMKATASLLFLIGLATFRHGYNKHYEEKPYLTKNERLWDGVNYAVYVYLALFLIATLVWVFMKIDIFVFFLIGGEILSKLFLLTSSLLIKLSN